MKQTDDTRNIPLTFVNQFCLAAWFCFVLLFRLLCRVLCLVLKALFVVIDVEGTSVTFICVAMEESAGIVKN